LQESTATLSLSEVLNTLSEKHKSTVQKVVIETKLNEQIRMLESVKKLYADQKIDQEALELLALEIAMGE
jgi:hypothetical protein